MGRLTRNYLYTLAYQILALIAPLLTAPYLARVLGASNLGIYSYVNSSGNIVTTLSLLGISAYGNRQAAYVRDNREELTRTFWEMMAARLILGAIGTLAYALYALANREMARYFLLYYPYILANFIDCSWVYVGLEDMRPAVIKNFITKVVNIAGIFLLVRRRGDVWIYILLLAATAFIANVSVYSQLPKYVGGFRGERLPPIRKERVLAHIRGSAVLFLPHVASLFYLQVDKVMLKWLTDSTAQVSFYDQAEKMINIPLSIITVMSTVMMPRLANIFKTGQKKDIEALLQQAGRLALMMTFPLMLGIFSIARQFVPWYLGSEFLPTAEAMRILAPIVLFNTLSSISGAQYFTATNQVKILMQAHVSAAVMNMIVNALLIPRYGYAGAAVATLLSSGTSVIIQYRTFTRRVDVRSFLRHGAVYAACAGAMTGGIRAVTRGMAATPLTTLLQIALGGCIYLGCLLILRDEAFLGACRRFLPKRRPKGE